MGYRGILVLSLACLFAGASSADDLATGSVEKLVIDPSTPTTLYAAYSGPDAADPKAGVYKSTDAGVTWTNVFATADVPFDIAIDPQSPSTLYVDARVIPNISDPGALYKSTDGGAHWSSISNNIPTATTESSFFGSWVALIAVDPVNEGVLYLASGAAGLYKSTDGGQHWDSINNGISGMLTENYLPIQLMVDPADSNTLYFNLNATNMNSGSVTQASGLYKSTDGGASWAAAGLTGIQLYYAALDPENDQDFVACANGLLQYSSDAGATWASQGHGCLAADFPNDAVVAIDPMSSSHVLVESLLASWELRASSDGGQTLASTVLSSVEMDYLLFDPTAPANVYAGTNGDGVYISRDGGATWSTADTAAGRTAAPQARMVISFSGGSTALSPGDFDDISVALTDTSTTSDATGIVYTVTLPSNLSLQSALPEFGNCAAAGQVVTCHATGLDLAAGLGFTTQIMVQASAAGVGNIAANITHVDQGLVTGSIQYAQLSMHVAGADTTANAGSLSTKAGKAASSFLTASNPCGCGVPGYLIDTAPAHGTITITNISNGAYTYTPSSGYVGSDSFTFELDNSVGLATPATVQVTVNDLSPLAASAAFSTPAGQSYSFTAASTAAYAGQTLQYSIVSQPAHGSVQLDATTGHCIYTPTLPYAGPDSFSFKVIDQYGLSSNVATDTVTVKDTAPQVLPSAVSTSPDVAVTGAVNVTVGYTGQILTYAITTQPTHGVASIGASDGSYSYTPATGFTGGDSFKFSVTDQYGLVTSSSVDFVVNDVAPTATGATFSGLPNTDQTGTLSGTAAYAGQTLSFAIVTQPANGSVSLTTSTGQFTYKPVTGYQGTDSFTFKVTDQYIKSSSAATVQITIGDIAATAQGGSVSTKPDVAVSGALFAKAAYPAQTLSFIPVVSPAHGSLNLNFATGQFKYTPAVGFAGTDSFTFQAQDQLGTLSVTATETVTVTDIVPKATLGTNLVRRGQSVSGSLRATAAYAGQQLTYSIVSNPAHGHVSINPSTGAYTYTPSAGASKDSFSFKVTDQWGSVSNVATINIVIY